MDDQDSELAKSLLSGSRRFAPTSTAASEAPPDPSKSVSLQLTVSLGPPSEMASQADAASHRTYASGSKAPSASTPYGAASYAPSVSYAPSATRTPLPSATQSKIPSTNVTSAGASEVPSAARTNLTSVEVSVVPSTTLSKVASKSMSKTTMGPCSTVLSKVASAPSATTLAAPADAWRSGCGAAGRDAARCQRRIRDLIGKHESKNVELERREGQLHRRLQMLECSMPAVMVWQAWRSQATPEAVHKLVAEAASGSSCRVTPSQHYDCRVREIEAQRKEACRRAEEARCVWLEREVTLQHQQANLELARQRQEERRACIEKLTAEARKLGAPCGEGPTGSKWPQMAESESSLHSQDLECLGRLESLAEAEACMKRQIAELEAKEQAYMCALARAEELAQLQQPQQSSASGTSRAGVDRSVGRSEPSLPSARTQDGESQSEPGPGLEDRLVGGTDSHATVRDQSSLAAASYETKETSASVSTSSKGVDKAPECKSACVGRIHSEANKSVSTRGETRDKNVESRPDVADKSEATISSSQYDSNAPCGGKCGACPCKGVSESRSGMMDTNSQKAATSSKSTTTVGGNKSCKMITVARADIITCQNIVNNILQNSELSKLPGVSKDTEELKGILERVLETAVCYEGPSESKSKTSVSSQSQSKPKKCSSQTSTPDRDRGRDRDRSSDRGRSTKLSTNSEQFYDATICLAERAPLQILGSFKADPVTKNALKSKSSINLRDAKTVGTQMSKRSQSTIRKSASKVSVECATSIGSKSQKSAASASIRSKISASAQTVPSASRSRTIVPSVASARSRGPGSIKSFVSKKTAFSVKSAASTTPSAVKSIRSAATKTSLQGSQPRVMKSKSIMSAKPSTSRAVTLRSVPSVTRSKATLSRQPSKSKSVGSLSAKSSRINLGSPPTRSTTICPPSRSPSKRSASPSAKSASVSPTAKSASISPSAKSASISPSAKSASVSPSTKSGVPAALPCIASGSIIGSLASFMGTAGGVPSALPCIATRTQADSPRTSTGKARGSPTSVSSSVRSKPSPSAEPSSVRELSAGTPSAVEPSAGAPSAGASSVKPCATRSTCAKPVSGSTAKSKCDLTAPSLRTAPSLKISESKSQRSTSPERFILKSTSRVISSTFLGQLDDVPSSKSQAVSSGTQAGEYLPTQHTLADRSVVPTASPSTVRPTVLSAVQSTAPPTVRPVKPSAVPSASASSTVHTAGPSASAHSKASSSVPPATSSSVHSKATAAAPSKVPSGVSSAVSGAKPYEAHSTVSSSKGSPAPSTASSSKGLPPSTSSAIPSAACVQPSDMPSTVQPCSTASDLRSKSYDTTKSKEDKAKPKSQAREIVVPSVMALGETRSKSSIPTEASISHRSVQSSCTPKDKSQKSLPMEQRSGIPSISVSVMSIARTKSDTMVPQKTSSKTEPEPLKTPKESKTSMKTAPSVTPKESMTSVKTVPSAKESKVTLVSSKSEPFVSPTKSKQTLPSSKSEKTVTPKASKSTVPSSKTSQTIKTKSSPSVCKSSSEKSVSSKKNSKVSSSSKKFSKVNVPSEKSLGKSSKPSASQTSGRSKCSVEVKEPKISKTEVRSVDHGAKNLRDDEEEVGAVHFTIELSAGKVDALASAEMPRAIEVASVHSGESNYQECVCDLREIYPPAPRSTPVDTDQLEKTNKEAPVRYLFGPPKMPQRAAATKLMCGCSEEQERARARPADKARPERCPHYARTARRRRRRHRVLPWFCECVNPPAPPPPPPPPPPRSSRCHLCGSPLLRPASVCSSSGGDAGRSAERIMRCSCELPGSEVELPPPPPAKRDQGVLAKLPKPKEKRRKSERDTLEVLFDRTTREAEQFLQSLRYGPPKHHEDRRNYDDSPQGSCTCVRNACDC